MPYATGTWIDPTVTSLLTEVVLDQLRKASVASTAVPGLDDIKAREAGARIFTRLPLGGRAVRLPGRILLGVVHRERPSMPTECDPPAVDALNDEH